MLCPCLVDGTPIPECVGCSVPIVFGYCRLSLLQILYRPYKAYEGGTQTTTGHISQQLANNHQQTCLELYGQTMIANWLHQCVLLSLAIILLPVCFSACFEGWCLGKPPHQAKQVGHAPESGGAGDPKACINDCKFASWKSKSTMLCCGIDLHRPLRRERQDRFG